MSDPTPPPDEPLRPHVLGYEGGGYPGPYAGPPPTQDDRNLGLLIHVLGMVGSFGILTGFAGPLIIWLLKKDERPYVDDQGKDALNFKLTMLIGHVSAVILGFATCGILLPLVLVVLVVELIFGVLAAIASHRGEAYRYPLTIRFVR